MASTATAPGVDRRPLISYLRVQRDYDRRIIAQLTTASKRIDRELDFLARRNGIGAAVRRDQLAATQAAIQRELGELWRGLGRTVLAGRADAAAAAIEGMYPRQWLRRVMPAADVDFLMRAAEAQARASTETLRARRLLSQIPLAESVYKSKNLVSGKVDEIVDSALARGASARELAADVRRFVRPDVRGGVRYAAMRLGRTELNNAFHAQQVMSGIDTPWTTGLRWNLSGSHPKPDECNQYAEEEHVAGMGEGVYRPEDVPPKPHPNCLCFTTPETVGRDAFVEGYMRGDYDRFVDQIMTNGGITIR